MKDKNTKTSRIDIADLYKKTGTYIQFTILNTFFFIFKDGMQSNFTTRKDDEAQGY